MALSLNGSTGVSGVDGSAGTPAVQGADSNTGISFGTDEVSINTGGTTRAKVDSSGRMLVGGLASPRTNIYKSGTNITPFNQIETVVNGYNNGLSLINYSASGYDPVLTLGLSKTNTQGANAIIAAGNDYGAINFVGNTGTDFRTGVYFQASCDSTPSSTSLPSRLSIGITASGSLTPTERMRITQTGFAAHNAYYDTMAWRTVQAAGTSYVFVEGRHSATDGNVISGGTSAIIIWTNGDIDNANNSYGALSDAKLKENIISAGSQWDDIKAVQVRKYNFKEETGHQTHTQIGVIAQEIELISPGLVSEKSDRDEEGNDLGTVTKSVNYSVLYMKAVKALQEAMERIENLETRLAALEGGN